MPYAQQTKFVAQELYSFFVSDASDERAVDVLAEAYTRSGYEIRAILDVLFRSEFFKEAMFKRVKCPAELVAGTLRITDEHRDPYDFGLKPASETTGLMGQKLLDPPTVEGWHTVTDWISLSSLSMRVNFAAGMVGDVERPGIKVIIEKVMSLEGLDPAKLVDICLDLMGAVEVVPENRNQLIEFVSESGNFKEKDGGMPEARVRLILELLRLIVSLREYQYA